MIKIDQIFSIFLQKNQLGEKVVSIDGSTDVLTPTKILDFQLSDQGNHPKASWISASHTTTFIEYEEVKSQVSFILS